MSRNRPWQWGGTVLLVLGAALLVINIFRQRQFSPGALPGGIAIAVAIFAAIWACNQLRLRAVRKSNPDAFVDQLAVYPQIVSQINALTSALGLDRGRLRASWYATVAINHSTVRIFGGVLHPRELVSVPSRYLSNVEIRKAPQGKWVLDSVELEFTVGEQTLAVDLCMMGSLLGIPWVRRSKQLTSTLVELRRVLAGSGRLG